MIEFKGECGHTIRAKDDDAGKVVRCSYCGREAQVPEEEDELDFLLTEVERTGDFDPPRTRRRTKTPGAPAPIRPKSDFNPFGVALKMCYAALIITVLIVVGKGVYKRVSPEQRGSSGPAVAKPVREGPSAAPTPAAADPSARGLLAQRLNLNGSGIYVTSVPRGADVYVRSASRMGDASILRDPNVQKYQAGDAGQPIELPPGSYEVGISMQLTDPGLMGLPGFGELRQSIESARDAADEKLEKYFIPHGYERVSLGILSDQSRVIVMYYKVDVDRNSWTPCPALFLPAAPPLSELMTYLPKGKSFGFDEAAVRGELTFYKVPVEDQTFLLDALRQIGTVPYRPDPKSPYQLFWIRLVDGNVSTRTLMPLEKKRGG